MATLADFVLLVPLAAVTIAAATDLWRFRIYNSLTIPLLITGLAYHALSSHGMGLIPSLVAACLGFVPMALLYWLGGLGAGDAKLMAGMGAWLGPVMTVHLLLASWIAAGVFALAVIGYRLLRPEPKLAPPSGAITSQDSLTSRLEDPHRRRKVIPFGVMILVGTIVTLIAATMSPN